MPFAGGQGDCKTCSCLPPHWPIALGRRSEFSRECWTRRIKSADSTVRNVISNLSDRLRRARLPFLFGLVLCLSACGNSCGIPGTAFYNCFYYYTDDLAPVRVNFVGGGLDKSVKARMDIPRAYIAQALPYKASETPRLPNEIELHSVLLLFDTINYGPLKKSRTKNYSIPYSYVSINVNVFRNFSRLTFDGGDCRNQPAVKFIGLEAGYKKYSGCRSADNAYAGTEEAPIKVRCSFSEKEASVQWSCVHSIRISEYLGLDVIIPDYRKNGGLQIAHERLRNIVTAMCPMLQCDSHYVKNLLR